MKRSKSTEAFNSKNPRKWKASHFLIAAAALYLLFIASKSLYLLQVDRPQPNSVSHATLILSSHSDPPPRPVKDSLVSCASIGYGRITGEIMRRRSRRFSWLGNLTVLESMARDARNLGSKAWEEVESYRADEDQEIEKKTQSCPSSVSLKGNKSANGRKLGLG